MSKPKIYLLTHLWTLPAALVSWLAVLFIWACWGHKLEWLDGLWCELKPNSWPARTWYKGWGGTTFVRGGFFGVGHQGETGRIDTQVEAHEHIHIEQAEASALCGMLTGLTVFVASGFTFVGGITAILLWTTTPYLFYLCASIQAVVRGEDFYRGNHLE